MLKSEAITTIKNVQRESSALETSSLITLFELDVSVALENVGITTSDDTIFYFHNNTKLAPTNIRFQDNIYVLCPIEATGFEITSQGVLPTPILRMTTIEAGIPMLSLLKQKMRLLGDLVGCKLTRRRTFARFLNSSNFNLQNAPMFDENGLPINTNVDELAELPKDIWFINRKSAENKTVIEYELNSSLDLENLQLPKRQMIAKRCNFNYRGEGCLYEYQSRRNDDIHGEDAILPDEAPPIATEEDKLITDLINTSLKADRGPYQPGTSYNIGESMYILSQGLKFYYVAKVAGLLPMPPNNAYWIADRCSKCLRGCKLRWAKDNPKGSVVIIAGSTADKEGMKKGDLPFGGFLALERLRGSAA